MAINQSVYESFLMLATKLDNDSYDEIVQLMYNLYMGVDVGYDGEDVIAILADATKAKKEATKRRKEGFKVIEGSLSEIK
tara:strand:+ start:544 stop:783 length:240 start_codon:yes stop_codon:yes gene_type:complete